MGRWNMSCLVMLQVAATCATLSTALDPRFGKEHAVVGITRIADQVVCTCNVCYPLSTQVANPTVPVILVGSELLKAPHNRRHWLLRPTLAQFPALADPDFGALLPAIPAWAEGGRLPGQLWAVMGRDTQGAAGYHGGGDPQLPGVGSAWPWYSYCYSYWYCSGTGPWYCNWYCNCYCFWCLFRLLLPGTGLSGLSCKDCSSRIALQCLLSYGFDLPVSSLAIH